MPDRANFEERQGSIGPPKIVIRATKRTLGGRRFEPVAERGLLPAARKAVRLIAGDDESPIVVSEAHGPFGVPDLLVGVGAVDWMSKRRASSLPPLLNEIDARIAAHASAKRGYSPESLARRADLDLSSVTRRLPHLLKAGHLVAAGPTSYRVHDALGVPRRLIAVELKVRDWRKALTQGRRYALWADTYVLVMRSVSGAGERRLVEEVRGDRAGLMLGEEMVVMPSRFQPDHGRRLLAAEYLAAARI